MEVYMYQNDTKSVIFGKIVLVSFLVLSIVFIAYTMLPEDTFCGKIDISDANMKRLEDELKALDASDKALKAKISNAEKNIDEQLQLKTYLDEQISITEQRIATANELIIGYQNQARDYADQIAALENTEAATYDAVREMLVVVHENSSYSHLEIILGAKDLNEFFVSIERVGSLLEYQTEMIERMDNDAATLEILKSQTEMLGQQQVTLSAELAQAEADLVDQKAAADKYIKNLQYSKTTANQQLKSNEEARDEFNKMIEEILEERQRQLNANFVGGDLRWPLDAAYKRVSSGFGYRTYDNANHLGIDIPADYAANVYASAAGTVVTATEHWSYGNYVLIDHGGGIATLYAHNSSLSVKSGDKVTQGQVIAKCGSTGQSSGNHVHFEIRVNGKVKNPLDGEAPCVKVPGT